LSIRWAARPAPKLSIKRADNPDDLPESVSLLLARRGFSGDRLKGFLNPNIESLSDWRDIGGIQKAAERIVSAVENSETILIHGDFDADGITASAILCRGLRSLGSKAEYYIPDRFEDGYGLGDSSIEACRKEDADLLITVDCGITANEYVDILSSMSIDTVITDHHQPGSILPAALAVVNPILDGDTPHSKLAGAGVAWMVLKAVFELLDADTGYLHELLQLAAVGTVSDVVELVDDNRIIAAEGLSVLRTRPFPGITALAESASIEPGKITSSDIAFYLGPRLNACGRIGHASDAVELLLAESGEEAGELIEEVEEYNRTRRKLDRTIEKQVIQIADRLDDPSCIVMADEGWHRGVIGIVASRLVSKYGVPSVMISIDDDTGYGSARSIPGIPIFTILSGIQAEHGIMNSLGGHPMAAGFSIPHENISILREQLNSILALDEWKSRMGSVLYVDGKLEEQDYNAVTIKALEMAEPFGEGNREPVWITRGAYPVQWRAVGKNAKHLSCNFRIGMQIYKAIGFNMVNSQSLFNGKVDLAFTLSLDTYRGDGSIQLILKDIRRHRRIGT